MSFDIGSAIRRPPQLFQPQQQVNPGQQCQSTTGCGHSTQDTFQPAQPPQQAQAAQQPQQEEKGGFLKKLFEALMPMIQQLLGPMLQKLTGGLGGAQ